MKSNKIDSHHSGKIKGMFQYTKHSPPPPEYPSATTLYTLDSNGKWSAYIESSKG